MIISSRRILSMTWVLLVNLWLRVEDRERCCPPMSCQSIPQVIFSLAKTDKTFFDIDVMRSVEDVKSSTDKKVYLPANKIDCIPLSDTTMLLCLCENDKMFFQINFSDTDNDSRIDLYDDSVAGNITHLSSVMTNNTSLGKAAIFMLFLPQVVYVNEEGQIKVKESIDYPAIDSKSHYLYCRNRSDHSIIRYNLSGLSDSFQQDRR